MSSLLSPILRRYCAEQLRFRARKKVVRAVSSWSIVRMTISLISAERPMLRILFAAATQRRSTSSTSSVMVYRFLPLTHMILRAGHRLSKTALHLMSLDIKSILSATMRALVVVKPCSTRCRGFSISTVLVCLLRGQRKTRRASVRMWLKLLSKSFAVLRELINSRP